MSFSMHGPIRDLVAFGRHLGARERLFRRAPAEPLQPGKMNVLAGRLHPRRQDLVITEVYEEFYGCLTYRLEPARAGQRVAAFRAGQYIAIECSVAGNRVSRPFSIASSPDEARSDNSYLITLKLTPEGYVAGAETHDWTVGMPLVCSEPEGQFTYEPLRDSNTLVCLAGGTGVTPFRSIAPDVLAHEPDARVVLIHGANTKTEAIYHGYFDRLASTHGARFTYTVVPATDSYITGDIIELALGWTHGVSPDGLLRDDATRRPSVSDATFFICGPEAMQEFVGEELGRFSLPRRRVRREAFAVDDRGGNVSYRAGDGVRRTPGESDSHRRSSPHREPTVVVHGLPGHGGGSTQDFAFSPPSQGSPGGNGDGSHASDPDDGVDATIIPARRDETILVAMERAGMNPPARCRSGHCGWCRNKLVAGTVRIRDESDGRRAADRKFSYIHPCAAYPVTDVEVRAIRNPLGGETHETGY